MILKIKTEILILTYMSREFSNQKIIQEKKSAYKKLRLWNIEIKIPNIKPHENGLFSL